MHNSMKNFYFICMYLFLMTSCTKGGIFIIVHGTWASASTWCSTGGNFFDLLEQHARKLGHRTISYTWSGQLDEAQRATAGKGLAKLIRSYPANTEFYIITHSHGGNVAIVASQELARQEMNKHRIKIVYALATPVDPTLYMPDMEVIDYFYNLFSLNDAVQPVMGFFYRTYPTHERIANIRIMFNGKEPNHGDIHHPLLATWLPRLHDMLIHNECSPLFALYTPGIIDFRDMAKPQYLLDVEREALLARDKSIQERMLALFRKQLIECDEKDHEAGV